MHGVKVLCLLVLLLTFGVEGKKVAEDDFDEFEFEFDIPEDEEEIKSELKLVIHI